MGARDREERPLSKSSFFFSFSLCQNNNGIPPACGGGFPFHRGALFPIHSLRSAEAAAALQRQGRIQMRVAKGSRDPPAAALEKANGASASTDANVAQPSRARCHRKARERAPCQIAFFHSRARGLIALSSRVMEEERAAPPKQTLFYGAGG